nr:MAG: ORF1 [TTV-like mini virus]
MPPFYRKRWRKNYWKGRRRAFYRWRPRKTFRGRRRRRHRVRRKRFFKRNFKKLRKITINEWQPSTIKKCKIEGYLCLFQSGQGRFSNNYCASKESYTPEHQPGGGGWSFQQLTLANLYTQNCEYMNYWTRSNNRLPMVRFYGTKITLFREPEVDYIFTYLKETPKTVEKYFFPSYHPLHLLTHKRKIIVPSFASQPHKKKPYKKIFIPPPPLLKNQWYMQASVAQFPLTSFITTACSLKEMFGSDRAENNNCTVWMLDTTFIQHPCFQYKHTDMPKFGYVPNATNYLWALVGGQETISQNKIKDCIYLGNSMLNEPGQPSKKSGESFTISQYPVGEWGNPFHFNYLYLEHARLIITTATQDPETCLKNPFTLNQGNVKTNPYVYTVRYNPFKDKGQGNEVYFIPNCVKSQTNWEPTSDPSIHFANLPLWLLFWGIEDTLKKMGKCQHLDDDWICVIKTNAFYPPATHYVPLSYSFVHGRAPYDNDPIDISGQDHATWYPKYKFQREAIANIIQTGPAVCQAKNLKNIQAKMKYQFLLKWGGNPSPMEQAKDPLAQPIIPTPSGLYLQNEINDPNTPYQSFLYQWDTRRDYITPAAAERIKECETYDQLMFTDGIQTSTDVPTTKTTPQTKETQETQTETLLQQLQQLQQYNQQLQLRFRKLKQTFLEM